jgi:hypothetical protein
MTKPKDKLQEVATETGRAGQRDSSSFQGAPPSNTAPHNCNSINDVVILRSGVDTLQLSYRGELREESELRLVELKQLARSDLKSEKAYAQWELGGELFSVSPHGSGSFSYVLKNPSYRLCLSNGRGAMPLAFVQVSSEILTKMGSDTAVQAITSIIRKIASVSEGPRISRIDICVDFSTRFDMESINRRQWVTRAKRIWQHVEDNRFKGWGIGLKGYIAARLYDKTAEILVSDKLYMREFWRECGWDSETPVWRLEFEIKREAFRQFGVESLPILELSAGLWSHLSRSWLRLAISSETDGTRSRWDTHPMWSLLTDIDFGVLDVPSFQRVRKSTAPSRDWMFRAGSAGILAFMALEEIDDFGEGCAQYNLAYMGYLDRFFEFRDSSSKEFVLEKLKAIRRRHNLELNKRPEGEFDPVRHKLARSHIKGKDGE